MIILQKFIYRSDLQANPQVKYLFGDNAARAGFGGQAKEMRGEPNAIGVATKHSPSMLPSAFFSDDDLEANVKMICDDLRPAILHLAAGGAVVLPADGLGTGLSALAQRAPKTNLRLMFFLKEMTQRSNK